MKMPTTQFSESFNKTVRYCIERADTAPGELYTDFVNVKEIYVNKEVLRLLNQESLIQNRTQSQKTCDPKGSPTKCDIAQIDSLMSTYGAESSAPVMAIYLNKYYYS